MKLTKLLAVATLSLSSMVAFATPQYFGDTDATGIIGNEMGSGYYIWNDDANESNWHLRWSSDNSNQGNPVSWFGRIVFEGGGLTSSLDFNFSGSDSYSTTSTFLDDQLNWSTTTNDSGEIDGLDFSVASYLDLMEFNLGSSLFTGLPSVSGDPGVAGNNIFIGDGFANPNVLVFTTRSGATYQSFEVNVAEPGTLALLGLGLAGLGFARRRQAS